MECTNTRRRTGWRGEGGAFTGAGWSTLTLDRTGGKVKLELLPDRGTGGERKTIFKVAECSTPTRDRGTGGEMKIHHLPGQDRLH